MYTVGGDQPQAVDKLVAGLREGEIGNDVYHRPNLLNQFYTLHRNSGLGRGGLLQKQEQGAAIYQHRLRSFCCLAYANALGSTGNPDHLSDCN
jgi:hypothetical protein